MKRPCLVLAVSFALLILVFLSGCSGLLSPARNVTGKWTGQGVYYTLAMASGERSSKVTANILFTLHQSGTTVTGSYEIYPIAQEPLGQEVLVPGSAGGEHSLTGTVSGTTLILDSKGVVYSGGATEEWKFTLTSDLMSGGVTNLDTISYSGRDSDPEAFTLVRSSS
jgi:hypothetical protein